MSSCFSHGHSGARPGSLLPQLTLVPPGCTCSSVLKVCNTRSWTAAPSTSFLLPSQTQACGCSGVSPSEAAAAVWLPVAAQAWDVALSILFLTKQSGAFLYCGDVHSLFIFLLQGLIQQTLKMYQLVLLLPTSPPSLPPAICFELFAQDLFSLWFYKFALQSKKPAILFSLVFGRKTKRTQRRKG